MQDGLNLKVTARIQIKKFAEGVDPEHGEAFEIIEKEVDLTGAEAQEYIDKNGGATNAVN